MEALQRQLGDERLTLQELNVTDPAALHAVLAGADNCINGVPTLIGRQMTIFEAALNVGVDYVDLAGLGTYAVKQMAWHQRFADAVVAVLGVRSDPGMSNVICRAVADNLDQIDTINLYWEVELSGPEKRVDEARSCHAPLTEPAQTPPVAELCSRHTVGQATR